MQNWIAWNKTVLPFKLHILLNWIVWNRTIFDIEAVITELFELKLFDWTE